MTDPVSAVEKIWTVLEAFASFGFCKAHAAAFALPTFQSAWLKTHWPAHFLSGVNRRVRVAPDLLSAAGS